MSRSTCEEISICTSSQSAICLHCNRRLCLEHLIEHEKITSSLINLSNEAQRTFQQIKDESDQRRQIFNYNSNVLNQWKTEQIDKIQHIYDLHIQLSQWQCELIHNIEEEYFQVEQNVKQQLENLKQQTVHMESIHQIEKMIDEVKEDNEHFKSDLVSVDSKSLSLNLPSLSYSMELLKANNYQLIEKKKQSSANKNVKQAKDASIKELIPMFSNISSIEQVKNDIDKHVKNQGKYFKLPYLVCSYLIAWCRTSDIEDKVLILNEHIKTIQKYLRHSQGDYDVIFGIQIFLYNEDIKEDKSEMMPFLFQFFLNHQLIERYQIVKWYNHDDNFHYKGFTEVKQIAMPFVESLLAHRIKKIRRN